MIYISKQDIQNIIGVEKPRKLKKYIMTYGNEIIESSDLTYDEFMQCYGIQKDKVFEVVKIYKQSNSKEELMKEPLL